MVSLSDRMKLYEEIETKRMFLPKLPIVARLDGRSFHSLTKGLRRPYDERLSNIMIELAKFLVGESCAVIGYTQSDEISLVFYSDDLDSQIFFAGKPHKMISLLAAMASTKFNALLSKSIPAKAHITALFDCRVWSVPTQEEAVNVLVWREQDATRNSISMAAQTYYSHQQLDKKNTGEMQEMLFQKGINWNDYPPFFKRGVYVQRAKIIREFTCEELEKLPLKHDARSNPDLRVERTEVRILDLPPILQVQNRLDVVFNGALPELLEDGDRDL